METIGTNGGISFLYPPLIIKVSPTAKKNMFSVQRSRTFFFRNSFLTFFELFYFKNFIKKSCSVKVIIEIKMRKFSYFRFGFVLFCIACLNKDSWDALSSNIQVHNDVTKTNRSVSFPL